MKYRLLGQSGLKVSVLGLGTMNFGSRGKYEQAGVLDVHAAQRHLDIALDLGVNLVDTADVYSRGHSEELVGTIIRHRRDRVVLATKVRMPMGDGPNDEGLSRHYLVRACEASLQRLGTDHIDLLQTHAWDGQTPLEETLSTLDGLVRAGKVRYVGCSNYSAWHLTKALAVAREWRYQPFVSQQIHYTLLAREAEHELIPAALDHGVGAIVWSPLAGGLLTGKCRDNEKTAPLTRTWPLPPVHDQERHRRIVDVLRSIAASCGRAPAEVALAWLLGRPGVVSALVGARTEDQLTTNLAAATLELGDADRRRLDDASADALPYPYWHQARAAAGRLAAADIAARSAAEGWTGRDG